MRAGPAGFLLAAGRPICRLFLGGRAALLGGWPAGFFLAAGRPAGLLLTQAGPGRP